MTRTRIVFIIAVLVGAGAVLYFLFDQDTEPTKTATSTPETAETDNEPQQRTIGTSVEDRAIEAYTFGGGETHLVFVGAIHGGYEWNTVVLSRKLMEYLEENPQVIPDNVQVTVIPALNPDGIHAITGTSTPPTYQQVHAGNVSAADMPPVEQTESGRFNARGVDLNRNFDCNWQPQSTWRGQTVDAGTEAFSEPEARVMRDFVAEVEPDAAVFFHSAANGVYGASCNGGLLPEGRAIMNTYAEASGYPAIESFDHYEITGDVEGWLASIGVPSVSVELVSHDTVEWERNKAGIEALFEHYKMAK